MQKSYENEVMTAVRALPRDAHPYDVGTSAAIALRQAVLDDHPEPDNMVLGGFTRPEAAGLFRGREPAGLRARARRSWRRHVSRRLVAPTIQFLLERALPRVWIVHWVVAPEGVTTADRCMEAYLDRERAEGRAAELRAAGDEVDEVEIEKANAVQILPSGDGWVASIQGLCCYPGVGFAVTEYAEAERLVHTDLSGLRPYQVAGVLWLRQRESALLADQMRLGKSAQVARAPWPTVL